MTENMKKDPDGLKEVKPFDGPLQPNISISHKLRALYGSVEEEAIPERFLDLLEKLEQAERGVKTVVPK